MAIKDHTHIHTCQKKNQDRSGRRKQFPEVNESKGMMEAELGDNGRKITIVLDYSYYLKPQGWFLVAQFVLGLLAICCTGSATFPTQIYFLIITIIVFLGSLTLSLLHLYFTDFNNQGIVAVSRLSPFRLSSSGKGIVFTLWKSHMCGHFFLEG